MSDHHKEPVPLSYFPAGVATLPLEARDPRWPAAARVGANVVALVCAFTACWSAVGLLYGSAEPLLEGWGGSVAVLFLWFFGPYQLTRMHVEPRTSGADWLRLLARWMPFLA
jgi:hypothetical protein